MPSKGQRLRRTQSSSEQYCKEGSERLALACAEEFARFWGREEAPLISNLLWQVYEASCIPTDLLQLLRPHERSPDHCMSISDTSRGEPLGLQLRYPPLQVRRSEAI
jgi:hypothetical protein